MYDAGYQRIRQIKRGGPVTTGSFVDDILYVVPGGFEVHRNQLGQVTSSIATTGGVSITTYFDPITGLAVVGAGMAAQTTSLSGPNTITKLILADHLGSMVAEFTMTSTTTGTLVVHGFGPWGNARNASSPFAEGQRGFTGHEHLAELGIVHMNGRLYDPVLGRFLQADPIIQAPHNAQSHNRYAYVMNNPLSFSDPSGFSAWTRARDTWVKPLVAIVVAYFTGYFDWGTFTTGTSSIGIFGASGSTFAAGGWAAVGNAAAAGFAAGGIQGGNIQSALQGAFSAVLFFGVGEAFQGVAGANQFGTAANAGKIASHAAVGCATAAAAGGSCKTGAASAGFAEAAGSMPGAPKDGVGGLVARAIVGGIASQLGGGKFVNGAMTAAFGYLFNHWAHNLELAMYGSDAHRALQGVMSSRGLDTESNCDSAGRCVNNGGRFDIASGSTGELWEIKRNSVAGIAAGALALRAYTDGTGFVPGGDLPGLRVGESMTTSGKRGDYKFTNLGGVIVWDQVETSRVAVAVGVGIAVGIASALLPPTRWIRPAAGAAAGAAAGQ